jgi:bifunctional non-homologous end joining protein LigD
VEEQPAGDSSSALPELIQPMLATLSRTLPPAHTDALFGYEMKWDGVRAVCYVDGPDLRILSRSDRDISGSYPELQGIAPALDGRRAVLDGEIVALDPATGQVSFGTLQQRMHVVDATRAARLARQVPALFLAFDVLHLDGRDRTGSPYAERRQLLESLGLRGRRWDTPPFFSGGGEDVLMASQEQGLEGVVAKRLDSTYRPGRRSPAWLKIKNLRTQSVVIGGWSLGKGNRSRSLGALLLGIPESSGLRYVGHVGTGFSQAVLTALHAQLSSHERAASPFSDILPTSISRDARWCAPVVVGEVAFAEWTADRRMRHPVWRGLRPDIAAADVTLEM